MVNTRHSAEDKRETPNELLCLQMRKYGKQNKKGDQDHSDEESEDSVEESRNTRSNRLRAQERARYAEAEDLEVELKPRRRRRTRILIDDSGDDDHEVITRQPRISSSRKPSTRGKFHSDHARNEYRQEYDDDDDDVRVRRSGRQRKLVYGTFDQKVLDRAVYEGGFEVKPCRKRKTMEVDPVDVEECPDMYSRVKRKRKNIKRDMYGIPIPESDQEEEENDDDEEDDDDNEDDDQDGDEEDDNNENDDNDDGKDDNDEEDEENDPPKRSYYLREHKPRTQLYAIPVETRRSRSQNLFRDTSPVTRRRKAQPIYRSPAHRKKNLRRRTAFNRGESSTSSSSSSSGESSDEERFQRRKAKSMAKSRNRCLPLNFDKDDLSASMVMKDRIKIGSSLADVDPMTFDKSVTFDTVGGLGKHIRALKEMIVFPLMYPEVFEKFKITPPRGCLFYGPPGTGKTLVARALANECSNEERRVAFFMRKGADCLSKWVGESERQLRLLFDQAYQMRPSIIFFDEIDGLAPVRSSRQDQIHSSIVSTLLALMDGLDNRGEIVVIGATNRIDSIDPALRRPGRFDREFLFPLPSEESRRQILHIHTRDWNPKLSDCFVREVASKTVGYCGADLKSLCTESALLALRRRYPQIYTTNEKLQLDVSAINISAKDFFYAMQNIVPASQRCHSAPGHALVMYIQPLMKNTLQNTLTILQGIFPTVLAQLKDLNAPASSSQTKWTSNENADWPSDDDENVPNIFEVKGKRKSNAVEDVNSVFLSFSTSYAYKQPSTFRPRLLLCGEPGQGQTVHLAPAVLHHLEQLPVHVLDLPSLYGVSAKTAEEACAQIFREAKVSAPSILYIPHIDQLWNVLGDTLKSTMVTMLQDIFPSSPILVLATCERKYMQLDIELAMLFNENYNEVVTMTNPSTAERQAFFSDLLLVQTTVPPSTKKSAAKRMLEVLPKAPPPEPRKLTEQEQKLLFEKEESVLRELRLFLRDVLNKLGRDRKFAIFAKPVDIEDVPDYYDIITKPMDLSTMMSKIDLHQYQCGKDFMKDIDLICSNCLEYNPATDPTGRAIRHRACALKDTAHAIMKAELDPDFEKQCVDIVSSRKKRGIDPSESAPKYYKTLPVQKKSMNDQQSESVQDQSNLLADDDSTRRSRRLRGRDVEPFTPLEYVEKQWKVQKSKSPTRPKPIDSEDVTPEKEIEEEPRNNCKNEEQNTPLDEKYIEEKSQEKPMAKKILFAKSASPLKARTKKKEVWSYRKRRGRWKRHSFPLAGHIKRDISRKFRTGDTTEEEDLDLVQHHVQRVTKKVVPDVVTDSQDTCVSSQESQEQTPVAKKSLAEEKLSSVIKHTETCETSVDTPNDTNKLSSSPSQPKDAVTVKNESKESSKESSHCHNPNVIDAHNTRSHRSVKSQESHSYTESDNQTSSQEAEEVKKENSDKAISKPATPLLGGAVISEVDSGVGSCVDSNADSLDSVDQAKKLANLTVTEKCAEEPEAILETVEEPMDTTPPLRLTRSRLQTAEQEKALAILEEPAQPLVVDRERLGLLLDKVVQETQYYHVECLEKLHCMLSQIIYLHRENYDKTKLLKDLEDCVARYTSIVAAQS